jgi:hypothetical protein
MPLFKKVFLSLAIAAQCLFGGLLAATTAQAAQAPNYFFKEFTVSKNCTEQHGGPGARVSVGLKFRISSEVSEDGSYVLQAFDNGTSKWAANWNGMKLQYRPGTKLASVPADFECIPGQEASQPFLAMSGFAQASEPYYEPEHFYGIARINGELEHILVFPRDASTGPAAIIVIQSVNSPGSVKLDTDGVIHNQ